MNLFAPEFYLLPAARAVVLPPASVEKIAGCSCRIAKHRFAKNPRWTFKVRPVETKPCPRLDDRHHIWHAMVSMIKRLERRHPVPADIQETESFRAVIVS